MLALIGMDSVPAKVLARLEAEGRVPRLTELRQSASAVALAGPDRFFPAAAYPTLWCGVPLHEHGVHYPFMWEASSQRVRYVDAFPYPPLMWDRISEAGGRVLVVDAYEAPLPAAVNGLILSGWQFGNRVVLRPGESSRGSRKQWERRLGRARRAEEVFGEPNERALRSLARTLVAGPGRAADLVEAAMPEVNPDLMLVTFPAVHLAAHRLLDPASVVTGITASAASELQRALDEVIVQADVALGRIVAALPPGADVIVFSPLGMGADTSRCDILSPLLAAILDGAPLGDSAGGGAWGLRAAVPSSLRARVASALPDRVALEVATRVELRGTDWSRTRAFAVPTDTSGLVRLNLRGRERDGIVDPAEVEALLAEIRAGLLDFGFEDGAPAAAEVLVTSEKFGGGERSRLLPDLVVRWSDRPARRGEVLHSPRFGTIRRDGPGSGRSGNHADGGWALVLPGAGRFVERPSHDVCDIASTALAPFGLTAAGRPLVEQP